MRVTVLDYGLSNLLSVRRAFERLGAGVEVTGEAARIAGAQALVLPGVGAFGDGMRGLAGLGLIEPLRAAAAADVPLLGICLGMQMLFEESDEFGRHAGLGLIPGRVERLDPLDIDGAPQRVPHVGWDPLLPPAGAAGFLGALAGCLPGQECYFVHSYAAKPAQSAHRLADTLYGGRAVCAAAGRGRVLGCQFHPEKSGPVGLAILEGFLRLAGG